MSSPAILPPILQPNGSSHISHDTIPWDLNNHHLPTNKISNTSRRKISNEFLTSFLRPKFMFYLPYLSSNHEKANCIAILCTGRPHSLGGWHFRSVWAPCLSHNGGGVPLNAMPKDTTSQLAGLFSAISPKFRSPSREAVDTIFKSLLV